MNLEDIYRLLRTDHVQVQGIVDSLDTPLIVVNQEQAVVNANRAFFETFRVDRAETIGRSIFTLGSGQWNQPELKRLLLDVVPKARAVVGYEISYDFPTIGHRTMVLDARRLVHPDSNSQQYLVIFRDITEARRPAGDDIMLLETRHRLKNLLSVVRAVATQTEFEGRSPQEYRDAFLGRLEAIIQTEDQFLSGKTAVDFEQMLRMALSRVSEDRRIVSAGPQLQLSSRQMMPLSMILHELVTNALKYGALSNADGSVRVAWTTEEIGDGRSLCLDWVEENGPTVKPPARIGFGTRLIDFTASHSLGGAAELTFDPPGLRARVTVPLD